MTRYRLRELLEARDMTVNELRRRSGVSGLTITNMLQGRSEAVETTLQRLADVLGVTPEELIDDSAPA